MASDAPYSPPAFGATMTMRHALQIGLEPDQVRAVLGGQAARLLAREEPLDLGPAIGTERISRDPLLERVHSYLLSAVGQMLGGLDPAEMLALAKLACEVGNDAPQAPVCRMILALIEERSSYTPDPDRDPRRRLTPGVQLIVAAAGVARTPDVTLPPAPRDADVAERVRGELSE